MPNGKEMLDEMTLEGMIKDWSLPEQFLARGLMEVRRNCNERGGCSDFRFSKRQLAIGTSGIGFISIVVSLIIEVASRVLGG